MNRRGIEPGHPGWEVAILTPKIVLGREFPLINVAECRVFSDIFFKIQFFCKMAKCKYNFVSRLILSQNFLYMAHGFPKIIPFPVQIPLKALRKESLEAERSSSVLPQRVTEFLTYSIYLRIFFSNFSLNIIYWNLGNFIDMLEFPVIIWASWVPFLSTL